MRITQSHDRMEHVMSSGGSGVAKVYLYRIISSSCIYVRHILPYRFECCLYYFFSHVSDFIFHHYKCSILNNPLFSFFHYFLCRDTLPSCSSLISKSLRFQISLMLISFYFLQTQLRSSFSIHIPCHIDPNR